MTFDPAADLRAILSDIGEPVTLQGGSVVQARPGIASTEDSLNGGETIVAGRTRTLAFAVGDVPGLESGKTLTWSGKSWRVVQTALKANGSIFIAFLGAP